MMSKGHLLTYTFIYIMFNIIIKTYKCKGFHSDPLAYYYSSLILES